MKTNRFKILAVLLFAMLVTALLGQLSLTVALAATFLAGMMLEAADTIADALREPRT